MNGETLLTRRREAIEWIPPNDEPQLIRRHVPGPWVYELEHPDGRIETLIEERYRQLLAVFEDRSSSGA